MTGAAATAPPRLLLTRIESNRIGSLCSLSAARLQAVPVRRGAGAAEELS